MLEVGPGAGYYALPMTRWLEPSRTLVNKGKKKGRIDWFEEGKFMRRGWYMKWRENGWLSHRKDPV